MNLHAYANRAISALHPNVKLVLVRCIGTVNEHGRILGRFGQCEDVSAQMQTLSGDELKYEHELYEVDFARKFFLSVTGRPVFAGQGQLQVGSDFFYMRSIQQFWRVYNVAEDFYLSGWTQVYATLQSKPPVGAVQALIASGLISANEAAALSARYIDGINDDQTQEEPAHPSGGAAEDSDHGASGNTAGGDGTSGDGANHTAGTSDAHNTTDHTGNTSTTIEPTSSGGGGHAAAFFSYD